MKYLVFLFLFGASSAINIKTKDWDDQLLDQTISSKETDKETQNAAAEVIEQNFEATVLKNKIDSMKEELSLFSKT